jgi:hypothetical protein
LSNATHELAQPAFGCAAVVKPAHEVVLTDRIG